MPTLRWCSRAAATFATELRPSRLNVELTVVHAVESTLAEYEDGLPHRAGIAAGVATVFGGWGCSKSWFCGRLLICINTGSIPVAPIDGQPEARRIREEAILRQDARAARREAGEAKQAAQVRDPRAPRAPAALGPAAGARRGARLVGDPEGRVRRGKDRDLGQGHVPRGEVPR